jgi:hypothetical protein
MLPLTRSLVALVLGTCAMMGADPATPSPATPPGPVECTSVSMTFSGDSLEDMQKLRRQAEEESRRFNKTQEQLDNEFLQQLRKLKPDATPADVAAIKEKMFDQKAHNQADIFVSGEGSATVTSAPTSTGSEATSSVNSTMRISDGTGSVNTYSVNVRDGKPWLVVTRDGEDLFSGPVGTEEERALLPENLIVGAQGLGLDFTVKHLKSSTGEYLEVRTGGSAPGNQNQ